MSALKDVYCVPARRHYPDFLRSLYGINKKLKTDGVLAPAADSMANMDRLYKAIDSPLDAIPTIHVGGTNGKGSVSFKTALALKNCGLRTGLFVSPHLASYRERVQVDNAIISEEDVMDHLTTIYNLCASLNTPATEFEISFLLAALQFRRAACDAVVLEVGCGGQFDATNVVQTTLSVICSVSLDHTRILGPTVEAIAENKAGIFKRGVPALVGPAVPWDIVQRVAQERQSALFSFDQAWDTFGATLQDFGFKKEYVDTDDLNGQLTAMVLCLLQRHHARFGQISLSAALTPSLLSRPPCRWEKVDFWHHDVKVEVILDVGHNPAAVGALVQRLRREYAGRNIRMIYAVSRDKDIRTCVQIIAQALSADHIHFAQSKNWRAAAVEGLEAVFKEETGQQLEHSVDADAAATVERVLVMAAQEASDSVVVICGTGYIMPPARAFLGIIEPRDDLDLTR